MIEVKMPSLKADLFGGSGFVKFSKSFNTLDGLMKADLLKDWIYDLEIAYDQALIEAFGERTNDE